jgi:uncharacterized membrane protein YfcA
MDFVTGTETVIIGILGGFAGGLFGTGGGIIVIPLLTIVFGSDPHCFQAASLISAIFVSAGAIPRHVRAKAIHWRFAMHAAVASLVTVALGVWLSSIITNPIVIERIFAIFLAYVAAFEAWKIIQARRAGPVRPDQADDPAMHADPGATAAAADGRVEPQAGVIGGIIGVMAGLLGLGGGVVAVPLIRGLTRFPLREAIATSSAMIIVTVVVASVLKVGSIYYMEPPPGETSHDRLMYTLILAGLLAPGGLAGARIGAQLMHRLPLRPLATAFALICLMLAIRMARIGA